MSSEFVRAKFKGQKPISMGLVHISLSHDNELSLSETRPYTTPGSVNCTIS